MVEMYSTASCSVCQVAKNYLKQNNIAFVEKRVDTDEEARNYLMSLSTATVVPQFNVNGRILVGFNPQNFEIIREASKINATA